MKPFLSMTRALLLAALAIRALGVAAPARAEEFLGVEPDKTDDGDKAKKKAEKSEKTEKAEAPRAQPRTSAEKRSSPGDGEGGGSGLFGSDWGVGGAIYANGETVNAQLTIGYSVNRYFGIDTTYWYNRYDRDDTRGVQYGPEIDLVLRYPNRTIVTPFAGAGPGYFKWIREHEGEAYDDGHSYTANAFMGVSLRIIRHLHVVAERKQTLYVDRPPLGLTDRERRDARADIRTSVGFQVVF